MPGITIVAGAAADKSAAAVAACAKAAPELNCVELLYEVRGKVAVVWNSYDGYPKHIVRTDRGFAIVEGTVLHDRTAAELDLCRLIVLLDKDEAAGRKEAIEWAQSIEGDFIVVLVRDRDGAVIIVNDPLGRLPLYIRKTPSSCIAAREIKSILQIDGPGNLDVHTVAQILLFGFPLGGRTLSEDIRTVPPASSIQFGGSQCSYDCRSYRSWNFESLIQAGKTKKRVASELVDLFEDTCLRQAKVASDSNTIVHLSGGLDSRAVAGGLRAGGVPFIACTFRTPDGLTDRDVAIAQQTAETLNVPWRLFDMQQPAWHRVVEVSLLRDGLNYGGMASRLEYLDVLRREYGSRTQCFTGDGGDKVLPDLRAPWWVNTFDRYVAYRLQDSVWPIEAVARMLGLEKKALRDEIAEYLGQYPERDMRNREVHFLIMERGWGWLLEGEERNRSYMWHHTPFYGRRFFEEAMSVPPTEKNQYGLYAAFLRMLNPRLGRLTTAKWEAPIRSPHAMWHEYRNAFRIGIPPDLRSVARRVRPRAVLPDRSRDRIGGDVLSNARRLFTDESVREVFRGTQVAQQLETCTELQFYYLVTQAVFVSRYWSCRTIPVPG